MLYNGRTAIIVDYETEQSAKFNLPDGLIGISISGGLDSTTLLYAVCQYITDLNLDIEILPIHSVSKQLSNSLAITQSIVDDVMERYPNVKIRDMEVFYYDENEYTKHTMHGIFYRQLYEKYQDMHMIIKALTALPSEDIVNEWPVVANKNRIEKKNSIHYWHDETDVYLFRPFALANKKLIARFFKYLKLPKRYLNETWSCTFYPEETKTFTEPCKKCYHCWEKKWAFGQF